MAKLTKRQKDLIKAAGAELLPDSKTHIFRMQIYGSKGTPYVVSFRNTNLKRWECGCRGWISHGHCRHLTSMKPMLDQLPVKKFGKPKLIGLDKKIKPSKKKVGRKPITKTGKRLGPAKRVITLLWGNPDLTMTAISRALELPVQEVKSICALLNDLNVAVCLKRKWRILCTKKRPKVVFAPGINGSLKDVFENFDKRKNWKRLEDSYVNYEGMEGTEENWKKAAQILLESTCGYKEHLITLGLKESTITLKELTAAWKEKMKIHHPDRGGSKKEATKINLAYETLKEYLFS